MKNPREMEIIICKMAEAISEDEMSSDIDLNQILNQEEIPEPITDLYRVFYTFTDGNAKIKKDNREELTTMADMRHVEIKYSADEKKYIHAYYWSFRGVIDNSDGSVKVTMTELKHTDDRYRVEKTIDYSKSTIERLMAQYPIYSIYQQPTRERVLRTDFDETIARLHRATESYRKDTTGRITERDGLFIEQRGEAEFRREYEEDIRRVIDDYALLFVFRNVNYDDHYGYLVTDLFGKGQHAS